MNIYRKDGVLIGDLSEADLSEANLSWADLSGANLSEANLSGADLSGADLSWANLSEANLSGADLSGADLSEANLSWADLSGADLSGAYLSWANLSEANLSEANLSGADLSEADLSEANLSGADLSGADLSGADLSGAKGLLNYVEWFAKTFEHTTDGVLVYKCFGETYVRQEDWVVQAGSLLEGQCNPCVTTECGSGINVAPLEWVKQKYPGKTIWQGLVRWEWLVGVVIPWNTDGKIRCSRLELVKIVE